MSTSLDYNSELTNGEPEETANSMNDNNIVNDNEDNVADNEDNVDDNEDNVDDIGDDDDDDVLDAADHISDSDDDSIQNINSDDENSVQGNTSKKHVSISAGKNSGSDSDSEKHDESDSNSDSGSDDDDESDDDSVKMKKIKHMEKDLSTFHTEYNMLSVDEIKPLLIIQRNSHNVIIDPNHKTYPFLTKYEKTKVIGLRSIQLSSGLAPFIKLEKHVVDPVVIANMELEQKKIPFIIKRPISRTQYEYWPLQELELL